MRNLCSVECGITAGVQPELLSIYTSSRFRIRVVLLDGGGRVRARSDRRADVCVVEVLLFDGAGKDVYSSVRKVYAELEKRLKV